MTTSAAATTIGAEPSFRIFIRHGVSHARETGYVCRAPGAIGKVMNKSLVQEEFGKTAASYLTSKPHALGKSLERLVALDRKSTRLNSSHLGISYAVFCLK